MDLPKTDPPESGPPRANPPRANPPETDLSGTNPPEPGQPQTNPHEPDLPPSQRVVRLNNSILRAHGVRLARTAKILDYGCGAGRHTYEYIDAGYTRAVGFDVADCARPRRPADRALFHTPPPGGPFRLPFPDGTFDLVTSTSVFEHVMNPRAAAAEIARVLKPGGAALHVFPARWRPVEPHIMVPFGGVLQARWWFWLWALAGVRSNPFQRGWRARDVVAENRRYAAEGIHYPPLRETEAVWRARFARVDRAEAAYIEATAAVSRVSRLARPWARLPWALWLYRAGHTRVILAREPK